MPNICSTYVKITARPHKIQQMYDIVNKVAENSDYTGRWTGNILKALGYSEEYISSHWYTRGWVDYAEIKDENTLEVWVEDAWSPHLTAFVKLANRFGADELIYSAEEPGCEIYITNDPELVGKPVYEEGDDKWRYSSIGVQVEADSERR